MTQAELVRRIREIYDAGRMDAALPSGTKIWPLIYNLNYDLRDHSYDDGADMSAREPVEPVTARDGLAELFAALPIGFRVTIANAGTGD